MDLRELIGHLKGRRTYTDLERDSGGGLGAARWQQIATRPLRSFPDPTSLAAIARALRVSERIVLLATATSLGMQVDATPVLADLLPPAASELRPAEVAAVLQVVSAFLDDDDDEDE